MEHFSIAGNILAVVIFLSSYKGFKSESYTDRFVFCVDPILKDREYDRFFSSGFLHGGWIHLFLNLAALLAFSPVLEEVFGLWNYLLLYFGSLLGGSLLSLFIHRNHGDYRALGASGAISGLIFSYILLFPESELSFFFLPIEIKGWVFGLVYVIGSIYGIKNNRDNIGHDAHLGGGIIGALIALALKPHLALAHWWVALVLIVPTLIFLVLIIRNPAVLLVENYWGEGMTRSPEKLKKKKPVFTNKKEEIDQLLDKIKKSGLDSLSDKEKQRLNDLSNL